MIKNIIFFKNIPYNLPNEYLKKILENFERITLHRTLNRDGEYCNFGFLEVNNEIDLFKIKYVFEELGIIVYFNNKELNIKGINNTCNNSVNNIFSANNTYNKSTNNDFNSNMNDNHDFNNDDLKKIINKSKKIINEYKFKISKLNKFIENNFNSDIFELYLKFYQKEQLEIKNQYKKFKDFYNKNNNKIEYFYKNLIKKYN